PEPVAGRSSPGAGRSTPSGSPDGWARTVRVRLSWRMDRPMIDAVPLSGQRVRLEPLEARHADDLAAASAAGDAWRKWTARIPSPDEVPAEIERRIAAHAAGTVVPWAVVADGRPVGMTTYLNIDEANRR